MNEYRHKNLKKYPFDLCVSRSYDDFICIETDGEQHSRFTPYFHRCNVHRYSGDYNCVSCQAIFQKQQWRDSLKSRFIAKQSEYILVRIPHNAKEADVIHMLTPYLMKN
jgi:hypothetical protein